MVINIEEIILPLLKKSIILFISKEFAHLNWRMSDILTFVLFFSFFTFVLTLNLNINKYQLIFMWELQPESQLLNIYKHATTASHTQHLSITLIILKIIYS